jgi:phage shock protein A
MTNSVTLLFAGDVMPIGDRPSGEVTLELIDRHLQDAKDKCREIKQTLDWLKLNLRIEQKGLKASTSKIIDLENRARLARRGGAEVLAGYVDAAIAELEKEEDSHHLRVADLESRIAVARFSLQRKRRRIIELKRSREIAIRKKRRSADTQH